MTAVSRSAFARQGTTGLLLWFALASVPAVLIGLMSLGQASADAGGPVGPGWLSRLAAGAAAWLPRLAVSALVAAAWGQLFARMRSRAVDPGWWLTAWLYAALIPANLPLAATAAGISFGYVFGGLIFGGTGRYLVSPVLVGVLFLEIGYPTLFGAGAWLPGFDDLPTWSTLAAAGPAGARDAGLSWWGLFAGRELAATGAPSALACLAGAACLVWPGVVSWRLLAGAGLGLWAASVLLSGIDSPTAALAWHWQLASGSFAFVLAFVATDPSTQALTRAGRWAHGGMAGALVVLFRVLDPEHPEGSVFAFVLASLFVPLADHAALALGEARRRRGVGP